MFWSGCKTIYIVFVFFSSIITDPVLTGYLSNHQNGEVLVKLTVYSAVVKVLCT